MGKDSDPDALVELYVLRCPDTGAIRYAGKANNAVERLKSHLRDSKRRNTPVYCWIRSLLKSEKFPVMEVVERLPRDQWEAGEVALISKLREDKSIKLLNIADGGDEPSITTAQRVSACMAMNEKVSSDLMSEKVRCMKRTMGRLYRSALDSGDMESAEWRRQRMVAFAKKVPNVFGAWLSLVNIKPHHDRVWLAGEMPC